MHWNTHSPRFGASLAPTLIVAYQFAYRRQTHSQVLGARRSVPSPWAARGRSFPSQGPAALPQASSRLTGDGAGVGCAWRPVEPWKSQSSSTKRTEISLYDL